MVKINQHRLVCSFPWNFNPITQPALVLRPWLCQSVWTDIILLKTQQKNVRRHTFSRAPQAYGPLGFKGMQANVDQWIRESSRTENGAALQRNRTQVLPLFSESIKKATEKWTCRLRCIWLRLLHNLCCRRSSVEGLGSKRHCKSFTALPSWNQEAAAKAQGATVWTAWPGTKGIRSQDEVMQVLETPALLGEKLERKKERFLGK